MVFLTKNLTKKIKVLTKNNDNTKRVPFHRQKVMIILIMRSKTNKRKNEEVGQRKMIFKSKYSDRRFFNMSNRNFFDFGFALMMKKHKVLVEEQKKKLNSLLEELSKLEHEQWLNWSHNIADTENISDKILRRWDRLWINYNLLSEKQKDSDRVYAKKVIKLIKKKLFGDE